MGADDRWEIDYEAEAIRFEGAWQTREDLAARIKALIDRGDYRLFKLSAALEQLETALSQGRILALRVSPQEAQAVEAAAAERGCSPAYLLRQALSAYLRAEQLPEAEATPAAEPAAEAVAQAPRREDALLESEGTPPVEDPEIEGRWTGR